MLGEYASGSTSRIPETTYCKILGLDELKEEADAAENWDASAFDVNDRDNGFAGIIADPWGRPQGNIGAMQRLKKRKAARLRNLRSEIW